jgi:hypothetical protein
MPVGGMKAETCTLPPPSTSASSALLAEPVPSMLRVRTRRGRTDEGGDVGEDGLEEKSSKIGGIRQSAKDSGERGGVPQGCVRKGNRWFNRPCIPSSSAKRKRRLRFKCQGIHSSSAGRFTFQRHYIHYKTLKYRVCYRKHEARGEILGQGKDLLQRRCDAVEG